MSRAAEAAGIAVETVTLPAAAGRPAGRKFGRVVHDILQQADERGGGGRAGGDLGAPARGERSGVAAAAEAARAALAAIVTVPAGGEALSRTAGDGAARGRHAGGWPHRLRVVGRRSWTVVDYKTDRREKRNVAQVQLYGLALQRATGLPVRGVVR